MAKKNRNELKSLFLNGMKPNQEDFAALIDSGLNTLEDQVTISAGKVGIKTTDPQGTFHVYDNGTTNRTTLSNKSGTLIVGNVEARNLSFDNNEIMARNGTSNASLNVQREGGDVVFFADASGDEVVITDDGKIGIGTTSPQANMHIAISGDKVVEDEIGAVLMIGNANGKNLSFDENEISSKDGAGTATLFFQPDGGDVHLHSNKSQDTQFIVKTDGKVGIGTNNPAANLHINVTGDKVSKANAGGAIIIGSSTGAHLAFDSNEIMAKSSASNYGTLYLNSEGGSIYHSGSIIHSSDKNLKTNIHSLDKGLPELMKLQAVSFNWKNNSNSKDLKYGFIAQDVKKVLGDIVYKNEKDDSMGISTIELIPVLVNAIQDQQKTIDDLVSRIEKLEKSLTKK